MGTKVFTLTIQADGAAFQPWAFTEIKDLLDKVSASLDDISDDRFESHSIRDANGNWCGIWTWNPKALLRPFPYEDVEPWLGKTTGGER